MYILYTIYKPDLNKYNMFDGNPFEKKNIKCHNLLVKLYLDMTT